MRNQPLKLAWRIASREKMRGRLHRLAPDPAMPEGQSFAQLFAWRDVERPAMLAWAVYDDLLAERIEQESSWDDHPLARWLAVRPTINLWGVASAWTIYWQHLTDRASSTLSFNLGALPSDLLLDPALHVSRGWLLWDFQLVLLADMVQSSQRRPADLAVALRRKSRSAKSWIANAVLPNAMPLHEIVSTRCLSGAGTTMPFPGGIAWRLHLLR